MSVYQRVNLQLRMISLSFGANFVCASVHRLLARSGRVFPAFRVDARTARLVCCLMPALAIKDQGCMPSMAKCGLQTSGCGTSRHLEQSMQPSDGVVSGDGTLARQRPDISLHIKESIGLHRA